MPVDAVPNPTLVDDPYLPTRNSLLSRLRDWDDHESWRAFFDTYWRFLLSIALKSGLPNEDARDVVQETVVAVAKGLRDGRFQRKERGSFKAWLRIIVRRRVSDHLRRAKARPALQSEQTLETASTPLVERIPDEAAQVVDALWEEEWNRNLADTALERVKQRVGAKQFQMFDLYAVKNWPVGEVTRMLHVNRAQVYLAKHRVTSLIGREIEKLRKRMDGDGGFAP